ncbi:DUF7146 domain-containing protein [Sphingomonas montanisoli]|uniref:Toprim domain-containing protein n=1 Tax=Sphingomonas montanisoli TaxID=2606412 RepID=A0A5D9CA61_9SPHN|nr:CHC2 zinc finger domain-containing protein [Sphingomonas montanisoli]TZG28589.1 toprim domain-containing protein [Sphingomonas montanisoli]
MPGRGNSRSGDRRRDPAADAEFRRLVEDAKARHDISAVVARSRKVERAGRAKRAVCAFHQERSPSMQLYDSQGRYHCFGCGADGDIVEYVMHVERLDFKEALRWLGAADLPVVDPAQRAIAAAEDEVERAEAIAEARAIWDAAGPAAGSPAEVYARSRGITMSLPATIRFGHCYRWRDRETGEVGPSLPALIGGVSDDQNRLVGLQRIFLRDGGKAKAAMKRAKLSLGRVRGGALRLGPPANEIIVCEGPEDGLTLAQEMPGRSVWVALGTDMMPALMLPPIVRTVVLAGDNDDAGRAAIDKAARALGERGLDVRTMFPRIGFKDFNDQLRGIRQ